MFGSIITVSQNDVTLSIILSVLVILLFVLFYNKLFAVTFDEAFTRAVGAKVKLYNMIIAVFTAITVVLGIRMMGTLLISSLIVFPAITAMQLFKSFKSVITASAVISVCSFTIGLLICALADLPIGATVVLVNLSIFAVFSIIAKIKA
jgi:zinc transport system permease protein